MKYLDEWSLLNGWWTESIYNWAFLITSDGNMKLIFDILDISFFCFSSWQLEWLRKYGLHEFDMMIMLARATRFETSARKWFIKKFLIKTIIKHLQKLFVKTFCANPPEAYEKKIMVFDVQTIFLWWAFLVA